MAIYLSVSIAILILGLLFESFNSKAALNPHRKKLPNYFFLVPSFILLFIVSAFRGDFTADYNSYRQLFYQYNQFGFLDVFKADLYQETGYIAVNRIIGLFSSNDIFLFAITAFVILYAFYSQFNKYSAYIWLSVFMFVTIGAFYTSFNTMRQILAVAIIFSGSKFLYERKMVKYFLVVILAALFHRTALIMFVFYFILNLKVNLKNMLIIGVTLGVSFLYFNSVLAFIQRIFYSIYTTDSYGMTGQDFTNVVLPLALLLFTLLYIKKIDLENTRNRVWVNAIIFYCFFSILGLNVQLTQRISAFFAPYALLLVPLILSKFKFDYLKAIYVMALVAGFFLYNYTVLSGSGYDPYYFIWDTKN